MTDTTPTSGVLPRFDEVVEMVAVDEPDGEPLEAFTMVAPGSTGWLYVFALGDPDAPDVGYSVADGDTDASGSWDDAAGIESRMPVGLVWKFGNVTLKLVDKGDLDDELYSLTYAWRDDPMFAPSTNAPPGEGQPLDISGSGSDGPVEIEYVADEEVGASLRLSINSDRYSPTLRYSWHRPEVGGVMQLGQVFVRLDEVHDDGTASVTVWHPWQN